MSSSISTYDFGVQKVRDGFELMVPLARMQAAKKSVKQK